MSRANPLTTHVNAGIAANAKIKTWQDRTFESFEDCRDAYWSANGPEHEKARWRERFGIKDLRIGSNVYLRPLQQDHLSGIPAAYAIVLYSTEIVRYYADGTFSVCNGGYNTPTTSSRISQFTPPGFYVWHDRKKLVMFSMRNHDALTRDAKHSERFSYA